MERRQAPGVRLAGAWERDHGVRVLKPIQSLRASACACLALVALSASALAEEAGLPGAAGIHTAEAIALFGEPKYRAGFDHFDYVNPDAPKGGVVRQAAPGAYDTLNSFAMRGIAPFVAPTISYDSLMMASGDEPATQYALLAQTLAYPEDYAWVEFKLRPEGRWHDGKPITADDVVFSYEIITSKGSAAARNNVADVETAEIVGPRRVRFTFKELGRKTSILNVGLMPILPEHYWQGRDFSAPLIEAPLTSGPYKITAFDLGRSITYERLRDYWGKDLAVNRGRFNFDTLRFDFYRDQTVAFEAFKAGQSDMRYEPSQKNWATGYSWPAAKQGLVRRTVLTVDGGFLLRAFFFNLRNPKFQDARVREALGEAFDFTWINKHLYHGFYVRSQSYFGPNDRAAANAGPPSEAERELLEPFRDRLPPRLFTENVHLKDTDGTQEGLRAQLGGAMQLLRQAGFTQKNGKLMAPNGQPFAFELLVAFPEFQLAAQNWAANLRLLGIDVNLRTVDTTQYIGRLRRFDYEVMVGGLAQVGPPGAEQRNRWGSVSADIEGSFNWMGIKDPAVDAMIDAVVVARDEASYLAAIHALDRVLMWNSYCVPLFNGNNKYPVAYWDRYGRPAREPPFDQAFFTYWWLDPAKDAALDAALKSDTGG